jgi:lysophospholipase L1-like esterase
VSWDMSNPQYWPYQEKVNGWAFDSITLWDYSRGADVQAFAYGSGSPEVASFGAFCVPGAGTATTAGDNCDDSGVNTTSATDSDSCQLTGSTYGDHCWWHWPASVNPTTIDNGDSSSCVKANDCGLGVITYPAGAAEPAAEPIAAQFAQTCVSDLSDTAVIVGDGGQAALGCPDQNWTSQGSFTWNFAADENGNYSSKIYFDQIGAGFGGHFWFGYSQPAATPTSTVITGTWNPPTSVSGWTDIKVAIPSYGANADDAVYTVDPGGGASGKSVQIDQGDTSGTNAWVDLGDFDLTSGASVSLSNVTPDYSGSSVTSQDLAWSAAAFIPTSGPSWDYTAMGDSYSTGQGNLPYDPNNDNCNRSNAAFPRQFAADTPSIGSSEIQHIACSGAEIENLTTTGQNGELPQIAQMSSSAKLVTVTIGGNDIDFSSVLTNCLLNPLTTCESAYNSANSSNLYTTIDDLKPELVSAYQDIKAAAPDADIVAVTYPLLFTPGTPCVGLSVPDVTFLNNVGEYLDNAIISSAQQAGIDVLDERYAFLGHQLCSSDPWVFSPTDTTVTDTSSAFHPTAAGLSQMAGDLGAYWSALQAGSAPTIWPQSVTAPVNGWLPLNLPYGIPTTAQAEAMLASLSNISAYAGDYNASASYWNFTTRNGCTTRDRVLQDEALTTTQWSAAQPLTPPDGGCPVQYGSWETPYDVDATSPTTPQRVTYNASNNNLSTGLQIDHIVPKSNAWETGAADWEEDYGDAQGGQMLTDFTNDRGGPELLAVSAASNGSKGNSPPEIWMPANPGMTCAYAKMWIAVKWEWNLEVGTIADGINGNEPTERIFLQDTLNGC